IAVSGPYMHDGRFNSLRDVVNFYNNGVQDNPDLAQGMRDATTGQPRRLNLSPAQRDSLVAFMRTLTDNTFLNDPKFSDPFRTNQNGGGGGGNNNNGPRPPGGGGGSGRR
ncbi:MAG: hypothetical protein KDB07_13680, partial [Planctomycetes bacterium]|nr:hypothetical protein [Planctomycetota bacterium]